MPKTVKHTARPDAKLAVPPALSRGVHIRLTYMERASVNRLAKARGVRVSELVRSIIGRELAKSSAELE